MPKQVYTERCQDGHCAGGFGEPAFIPDGAVVCNGCLMLRYGPMRGDSNVCLDPHGIDTWYHEDEVIAALRRAAGL